MSAVRPASLCFALLALASVASGCGSSAPGATTAHGPEAVIPVATHVSLPELAPLVPRARAVVQRGGDVWEEAAAVRELVRAALPASTYCGTMAEAFWSVGSRAGLPLRVVQTSADGLNSYDSHVTVEVWLEEKGRWVISDPTFDGWWSVGRNGSPVGSDALQHAAAAGGDGNLFWHGSSAPNAVRPSRYYVDPVLLYRFREVRSVAPGSGAGSLVVSVAESFGSGTLFVTGEAPVLQTTPPRTAIPVRVLPRPEGPSRAGLQRTRIPPGYAGERLVARRVRLRGGVAELPFARPGKVAVVSVATRRGTWTLSTPVADYPLVAIRGGQLSPIVPLPERVTLVARGAGQGPVLVRIWAAKRFPRERELVEQ